MSQATKSRSGRPVRRSSGGGGGGVFWMLIAVVVIGAAGVYVFAPELPRQWFGTAKKPADKGDEPTAPQNVTTTLANKDNDVNQKPTKPITVTETTKPDIVDKPVVAKPKTYPDEQQALAILEKARAAYKAMDWNKAAMEARKITSMSTTPATGVHAQDIIDGSAAIAKLFKELDDKDELIRYYDTHPSLVILKSGASSSMAVPIASIDDPTPIESDPLAYIAAQRKTGKVAFLIKGKKDYIPSSLPADIIGEVEKPDLDAIVKEKLSEFETRLNKLRNSNSANNPLAWYDAGKFAYRNRIDGYVTEMLNQAVVLDPNLVSTVREDKAAGLYASLVSHATNGNKKQAAAFMAIIAKKFADTDQGKQARLYYDGKTAEVLQAAKLERERQRDEERQRRQAQLERAKKLEDQAAIAKLEKMTTQEEEPVAAATVASGDEGKADALFSKGRDLYNQALEAGNTPKRDELYEKAYQELHAARAIYSALVEKSPNNEALGFKLLECNKLHYGAIKQRRFH